VALAPPIGGTVLVEWRPFPPVQRKGSEVIRIDAGKANHRCVVIDGEGNRFIFPTGSPTMNQHCSNSSPQYPSWQAGIRLSGRPLAHDGPALLIALLVGRGQNVLDIPGRIVHHASKLYRERGKTDAKDAAVIADQARMRKDFQPLRPGDDLSTGLGPLTARLADQSRTG
jgi:hypothetical protein